jgi:hypothetical protein
LNTNVNAAGQFDLGGAAGGAHRSKKRRQRRGVEPVLVLQAGGKEAVRLLQLLTQRAAHALARATLRCIRRRLLPVGRLARRHAL